MQLTPIAIAGWNCTCTVEESPGTGIEVVVHLTPRLEAMPEITAGYRSRVDIKLDRGDDGLRQAASLSALCGSAGGGRITAVAAFTGATMASLRAVVVSLGSDTHRLLVSGAG